MPTTPTERQGSKGYMREGQDRYSLIRIFDVVKTDNSDPPNAVAITPGEASAVVPPIGQVSLEAGVPTLFVRKHKADLVPGDPWYLKRFYVDGHEYNVTAIKTTDLSDRTNLRRDFEWITIRTPVPAAASA